MNEMCFSVPKGTHELSFGIVDDEGGELFNFYLIFLESVTMNLRQVTVYGDYSEEGLTEQRLEHYNDQTNLDAEFGFEFNISEKKKVIIDVCMGNSQYHIYVKY